MALSERCELLCILFLVYGFGNGDGIRSCAAGCRVFLLRFSPSIYVVARMLFSHVSFSFSQMRTTFKLTSWNVNGARKLKSFLGHSQSIGDPDVLFLQETWISSDAEQLEIAGYVAFHAAAVPTHGHDAGGLSSFFKLTTFAGGQLERKDVPVPWVLTVRWSNGDQGVLFVNVYCAVHTGGVVVEDFELFADYVTELRSNFGGDEIIIAGDFNADRFRRPSPRNESEQCCLTVLGDMEADRFQIFPKTDVATYVDAGTTIDYIAVSPASLVHSFEVLPVGLCQHLPLSIRLSVDFDISVPLLPPRSPNLVFVPDRVDRVQQLLRLLEPDFACTRSVDESYALVEAAFLNCGVPKKASSQSHRAGSWWRYVPEDLRKEVDQLEEETRRAVTIWQARTSNTTATADLVSL